MGSTKVLFTILDILIAIICVSCNTTIPDINIGISLSRKKLKEINDITTLMPFIDYNVQSDLVADFFDNVKKIFEYDMPNTTYVMKHGFTLNTTPSLRTKFMRFIGTTPTTPQTPSQFKNAKLAYSEYSDEHNLRTVMRHKINHRGKAYVQKRHKIQQKSTSFTSAADLKETGRKASEIRTESISEDNEEELMDSNKAILSCILCDNVNNKDCNDPKDKLLPLAHCSHVGDMCYSMQTPFGIIDRGCYNTLLNHSMYVCPCNLCNSIPIHELPITFINKTHWLSNVQELSHMKRLRKSVYSQISCIQCEVNQTIDDVPDINCMEGKFRLLPSQNCASDEICGIKSIKSKGYIWRGCIKNPRYNYLWNFCDSDLCNFDPPTSLFDIY